MVASLCPECPSHHNQHAEVIRVVIGNEQRFAENSLTRAMRNLGEQICRWISHEIFHLLQIATKLFDRFLPKLRRSYLLLRRPITFRPFRRDVFWIATELEDVPLRDAHVLKHLPRRVRQTFHALAAEFGGKARDEVFEGDVRAFTTKDIERVIAQRLIVVGLIRWFSDSLVH